MPLRKGLKLTSNQPPPKPHKHSMSSSAVLHLDLIADILRRLPVEDLLRCRSVSKQWLALIDNPHFVDSHVATASATNLSLLLISNSHLLHVLPLDPLLLDPIPFNHHPLMNYNHEIKVFGSANGLLCISNVAGDTAVWNPSTRRHRVVPYLPLELKRYYGLCVCKVHVYGFGYDAVHDDYKLVRVAQFEGVEKRTFESETKVYSLRTNTWKRIADVPYRLHYRGSKSSGACAGGALHWTVGSTPESAAPDLILAVDLAAEGYCEVAQPEGAGRGSDLDVGVLKGCLCLSVYFHGDRVELWVMEEYGIKESWTKLISLSHRRAFGMFRSLNPLVYSKHGDEVLIEYNGGRLFWFHLREERARDIWIRGLAVIDVHVIVGSLVPVDLKGRPPRTDVQPQHNGEGSNKRDDFLSEGFKLVL